jgi:hypothetical protein
MAGQPRQRCVQKEAAFVGSPIDTALLIGASKRGFTKAVHESVAEMGDDL